MARIYKVTHETIAKDVGVSKMTISLALRGDPKISTKTRERVLEAAKRLGYRPNPYLSAYGSHIRSAKQKKLQAKIAYLSYARIRDRIDPASSGIRFFEDFYIGARDHADSIGFGVESFALEEEHLNPERLNEILVNRGILGIVLHRHFDHLVDWEIDWETFAIASIGSSRMAHSFHSVDVDLMTGMLDICDNIRRLGYRRPGLALLDSQDRFHRHAHRCVLTDYQQSLAPKNRVPHLITEDLTPMRFGEWVKQYKPDVIVGGFDEIGEWIRGCGLSLPGDIGFIRPQVTAKCPANSGIKFNSRGVGAAAIDLIAGQINRNERGRPSVPKHVTLRGSWSEGETVREQV